MLKGKIALVTGSTGGIGGQIALDLAKKGVNVVLFGGTKVSKLEQVKNEILALGVNAWAFPCNFLDKASITTAFNEFSKEVGKLDILINNAGMAVSSPVEDTDIELVEKIMQINMFAPYLLTSLSLPYLKKSSRASIINIASVTAHLGYPLQSAYVASKHALLGFTKSLASEVYKEDIRVHAVSPGGVYTDMIKVSRPDLTGDEMIMPSDISNIVMFLLENRTYAVIDEISVHRSKKEPFLV